MQPKTILVIGAGMVGAACALRLQAAGIAVTLIDPGDPRRAASFGNAGHLGVEQVAPWPTWENVRGAPLRLFGLGGPLDFRYRDALLWGPWALRFLAACAPRRVARGQQALTEVLAQALPAWLRLATLAAADDIVRPHGHASVWMSPRAADAGRARWARTPTGAARMRDMTSAELERYRGVLREPPSAGLHFSGTGQLSDPQGARDAVLARFAHNGGESVMGEVKGLNVGAVRASVILATGVKLEADAMLIAAGAWSGPLLRGIGANTPLIGERGYSVQSAAHTWPDDLPTTVFEERSVVVSRFSSGLRATSFIEFGAPDAPADPRKWRRLIRHLGQLGIAFENAPDRWMGPRPTLPDYLPAIGRLKSHANVFYAFGHQHLGITLAAVTAEIIEALATSNAATFPREQFQLERFG